jgi:GDPmannose 4,6-dehydratase
MTDATLIERLQSFIESEGKSCSFDPELITPEYVHRMWGDPTKAKAKLKWNPNKTSFEELVKLMVESDMAKVASEDAAMKVRTNLAEYLEKGIVK